ncbi:MAG TPA: ferritin-like domain-containing protein [Solirubrobacteraceae bacterium]|nr:ferritin-like domain-containing protein [Solirubrobacteraceae bacterium]
MATPRPTSPADERPRLDPREAGTSSRRGLSRRLLFAAAAPILLSACGGEDEDEREEERDAADLEIVRFLLGIEDVEAAFWAEAEERGALESVGAEGIASEIARNEREHVAVLERWARRLGGDRPPPPSTGFDRIFAAGPQEVLSSAATLENLSAAAYLGQINRLQDRNLLAAMLAIHSVEGRQAAAVNRLAGRGFSLGTGQLEGALPDGAFAEPMDMGTARTRLRRYTGGRS